MRNPPVSWYPENPRFCEVILILTLILGIFWLPYRLLPAYEAWKDLSRRQNPKISASLSGASLLENEFSKLLATEKTREFSEKLSIWTEGFGLNIRDFKTSLQAEALLLDVKGSGSVRRFFQFLDAWNQLPVLRKAQKIRLHWDSSTEISFELSAQVPRSPKGQFSGEFPAVREKSLQCTDSFRNQGWIQLNFPQSPDVQEWLYQENACGARRIKLAGGGT